MLLPSTFFPDPGLEKYILSYGILEVADGITETFLSPPLGISAFIIQHPVSTGTSAAIVNGEDLLINKAAATGQVTATVTGYHTGKIKTLLVFFRPLGMYQLFGCDMSRLTNTSVDLKEFLGAEKGMNLVSKLGQTEDDISLISILNDFFSTQNQVSYNTSDLKRVLDFIHHNNGNVSIKEIEKSCYVHRKSIERHFQLKIGITPKIYSSIFRFKCLMNYLEQNPKTTWHELSNRTGYYDQSHMARYFKEYLKVSPNQLVTLDVAFINYLLSR